VQAPLRLNDISEIFDIYGRFHQKDFSYVSIHFLSLKTEYAIAIAIDNNNTTVSC
jgi:hypothetical protein